MTHMLSQSSRESLAKHALTQGGERCTRSVLLATTNLGTHRVESVTERAARPHKNIMYSNASCNISARISSALIMRTFAAGSLAWATQCIFERGGGAHGEYGLRPASLSFQIWNELSQAMGPTELGHHCPGRCATLLALTPPGAATGH